MKKEDMVMKLHVDIWKDPESDWYVAECPALPGCMSQGKTVREAKTNIREAMTAWLEAQDVAAMKKEKTRAKRFMAVAI